MTKSLREVRVLVTGGGSGGHVTPAIATIEAIKALAASDGAWKPVFHYVGSQRGIERRLAQDAGVPYSAIATGKLRRSRSMLGLFSGRNLLDALRLPWGVLQALVAVLRFRPHVVLSTGGFVCVPPVLAAWLARAPVVTHEQTVQMGLANRIASRLADRIALTFESARADLPQRLQAQATLTGNPVRRVIFDGDPAAALALAGFPDDTDLPTVYVTGGAQGAQRINRAVADALPKLLAECRIIHQCGQQVSGQAGAKDRLLQARAALPVPLQARYHVIDFVGDEIGHIYALADVVVSRSGAGTLAEIFALGKPAVLIPLVPTGGDEQRRNAQHAESAGAATVIEQDGLTGESLCNALRPLLADTEKRATMARAAQELGRVDAARQLADLVIASAKRSGR